MIKQWQDRLDKTITRWPTNKEKIEAMEEEIKELRKFHKSAHKMLTAAYERGDKWYKRASSAEAKLRHKERKQAKEEKPTVRQASSLTRWIGGSPFH